jgi:hypothetical protein
VFFQRLAVATVKFRGFEGGVVDVVSFLGIVEGNFCAAAAAGITGFSSLNCGFLGTGVLLKNPKKVVCRSDCRGFAFAAENPQGFCVVRLLSQLPSLHFPTRKFSSL